MYEDEYEYIPKNPVKDFVHRESPPYLLLYEEDIADLARLQRCIREPDVTFNLLIRHYLIRRFFDIMEGFHKGQLDLTGRHMHRYEAHARLWVEFVQDFAKLAECLLQSNRTTEPEHQDFDEQITPYRDEHAEWIRFCKTWKIPHRLLDFDHIAGFVERLDLFMRRHPRPIIQDLCLVNLPDDVLEVIFAHASVPQGRLLAATCRRLSTIGYRHIFKERSLCFMLPLSYWKGLDASADKRAYMNDLALLQRSRLLSSAQFLISNPDGVRRINELLIMDTWVDPRPAIQELAPELWDFSLEAVSTQFYAPIYAHWKAGLRGCQNLTYLCLRFLTLDVDFVRIICSLWQLKILNIFQCKMPTDAFETFGAALELTAPGVETLSITVAPQYDDAIWLIPPIFTQLRKLTMEAFQDYVFTPVPPSSIVSRYLFFGNLERLNLSNFSHHNLPAVIDWLRLLPDQLCLKFLQFSSSFWVPDDTIISILGAFRAPRLQILVLSGLQNPKEQLFRSIANLFPILRGLSLDKRASNRQRRSRPVDWPLQTSYYARWAGHLPELRFFSWNSSSCYYWHVTNYPILRFESDFSEDVTCEDWFADEWEADDYTSSAVRAFAAYCPKLQWYSSFQDSLEARIEHIGDWEVKIEQNPGLKNVKTIERGPLDGRLDIAGCRCWNPVVPDVTV